MNIVAPTPIRIEVDSDVGAISGLLQSGTETHVMLALAHGAGAGMRHRFMEDVVAALADAGVATMRYEFPYMEQGRRRPDRPEVLQACVRAAVGVAAEHADGRPLLAGGKSLGGRMTTSAAAAAPLEGVRGIVLLGFPLHPPRRPATGRAEHLGDVTVPMLFLQGTRDDLADLELMREVCGNLGDRATLQVVEGADHGFHVLKRSGRTDDEVIRELALETSRWARTLRGR